MEYVSNFANVGSTQFGSTGGSDNKTYNQVEVE